MLCYLVKNMIGYLFVLIVVYVCLKKYQMIIGDNHINLIKLIKTG